jgi:GntR family transcriptional regulator/MocR family aminotransferase
MQIPVLLDRSRPEPLTDQLVEQLRDAIRHNRIPQGTRLPSSRQLSEQLAISRNTVVRAYDGLVAEGYVDTRPASGMFVAAHLPDSPLPSPAVSIALGAGGGGPERMPLPGRNARAADLLGRNRNRLSFDFFPGQPSVSLFPLKTWRRLLQQSLSQGGAVGLAHYGDPAGSSALRSGIAGHLAASRGVVVDPACIVIVNGIQEAINIAARLFLAPGAIGVVETPCYQGAAYAFEASGARLLGASVDEDGLQVDQLPDQPAGLLYVTPSHQYPTGHVLSLERRGRVIAWARRNGCYVLEDDYDCDFRYEGSPLPAIAAMAPDCTLYLGTFSKSLGAGLRLGYIAAPPRIAEAVRTTKALLNNGNSWLDQAALAEMIRSGGFRAHLTRLRGHYAESRDSLLASLRRHFGDVEVSGGAAGLHIFWRLPAGVPDAAVLESLARRVRVGVYSLASGGAYEVRPSLLSQRGIILGYACMTPRQIEQGVARLSDAIDDAVDKRQLNVDELAARPAPFHYSAPPASGATHLAPQFRQRPALRGIARHRAGLALAPAREARTPMPLVKGIYRYPIKGLSPQGMNHVALEAGASFPHDRVFALARPGAPIDPVEPKWAKKSLFLMLMLDDGLADVKTHVDVETHRFTVMHGNTQVLAADLDDESDWPTIEAFFHQRVPTLREAPRLVRARNGHFMDKPENLISLINLATVRSLEEQWGYEIDPLRFRANFYIDGARPWEEFEWIGADIRLGDALFTVDRRNGRCGATNVNPATGRRDLDIPGSLRAAFGHKDLGIYLTTRIGGRVNVGDIAEVPQIEAPLHSRALRGSARPAAAINPAGDIVREHLGWLAMPGLRDGKGELPPLCRGSRAGARPYRLIASVRRMVGERRVPGRALPPAPRRADWRRRRAGMLRFGMTNPQPTIWRSSNSRQSEFGCVLMSPRPGLLSTPKTPRAARSTHRSP